MWSKNSFMDTNKWPPWGDLWDKTSWKTWKQLWIWHLMPMENTLHICFLLSSNWPNIFQLLNRRIKSPRKMLRWNCTILPMKSSKRTDKKLLNSMNCIRFTWDRPNCSQKWICLPMLLRPSKELKNCFRTWRAT